MRICVINPDYYRSSGVTIAIKRIHQSLIGFNVDNYFVCCSSNSSQDISWIPGDRLTQFDLMSLNPFVVFLEFTKLKKWIEVNNIDLLHIHHRRLAILLSIFSSFLKINFVYSANLTYKFNVLFWIFSPKYAIAVTESVTQNLRNTTRTTFIKTIGNPTEFPEIYLYNGQKADLESAICVARLEDVKGHRNLLKAWSVLKNKMSCKLILVGEGALLQPLKRLSIELGIESLVYFKGYVKNVKLLYEENLFSILVSNIEGQGIVTIEAAAAGRPTLLTDVDGSRDCIPPGLILPNGITYGDIGGLSSALEYWFKHPKDVFLDGQNFFKFHKKNNSIEALGKEYAKIYSDIVSG